MACVNCSKYDPWCGGGYCKFWGDFKSPYDSCSNEDGHPDSQQLRPCRECFHYDSDYQGGYCNKHGCEVSSSSHCNDFIR